ncbi:ERI1 exoribonuclease 3-like [Physella acuta]|uniref:ERI1 exoribonuclease 3-like n=1 Tax=Physella acuta TaxID=109671 RepID=UPI0027DB175A|nr:ERI1 exoribonuclease 3-like [Physella acuta]
MCSLTLQHNFKRRFCTYKLDLLRKAKLSTACKQLFLLTQTQTKYQETFLGPKQTFQYCHCSLIHTDHSSNTFCLPKQKDRPSYSYRSSKFYGSYSINKIMASSEKTHHQDIKGTEFKQNYDYFLVLDFEATCDDKIQPNPQEIIEFPVLKVNARTLKIESEFHKYVAPQFHPRITPFCSELTGIIQSMVDNQLHLPEVLQSFHHWMENEGLLNPDVRSIFVTCGDWDLKSMLPKQCAVLDLLARPYFSQWINIKKSYADVTGTFPKGMMVMLNNLNLKHIGRHHSGIDDCRNIANVLIALLKKGYVFKKNGSIGRF